MAERTAYPLQGPELEVYIYDYLVKHNLTTTARTFMQEAQVRLSATDQDALSFTGGLSDWWSIFWGTFVSVTVVLPYPQEHALGKEQLEMGHLYSEEEQMQRKDASFDNSSGNKVLCDRTHEGLVANSSQMHSQLSHQIPAERDMMLFGQGPIHMITPEHMQQPYQQSTENALEQKQYEMGHHYIEEEQMQRRDERFDNLSGNVAFSDRTHEGLVVNSSQMHSQLSHQIPAISELCLPNSIAYSGFFGQGPIHMITSEHMQQPYQQSAIGMNEDGSGITFQSRNLQDHYQLSQQNNQQTTDALQQGKLLSAKYENMNRGQIRVFGDILEGQNAVHGSVQTVPPQKKECRVVVSDPFCQDVEGASDVLDLSEDVAAHKTTGTMYEEVIHLKASSKKISCCDFSSDGKFLASAGDEKKIFTWDFNNNLEMHTWKAHSSFISDISFGPNNTMLATASSDKTVRLWDISQYDHCYRTFNHNSRVRSVDFHPTDPSIVCSSADSGKIFFWTKGKSKPRVCGLTGRAKVRFHPSGGTIASAIGSTANIIDVEKDKMIRCLQGNNNNKLVQSICWSEHGECIATVSEDCVKVWSRRGEHLHELSENLSFFRSCTFHPKYPNTLVIGGCQTITLWNFAENKKMAVQPHRCHVSDLAACHATSLIASASHDGSVKISC